MTVARIRSLSTLKETIIEIISTNLQPSPPPAGAPTTAPNPIPNLITGPHPNPIPTNNAQRPAVMGWRMTPNLHLSPLTTHTSTQSAQSSLLEECPISL